MLPHSLSSSPLLINDDKEIILRVLSRNAIMSVDGQENIKLPKGKKLKISKAIPGLNLIHPTDHDFFSACRNKLGWSMRIGT